MTWISLISLLVLSSSAFGRSTYGSYSAQEPARDLLVQQRPVQVLPTSQLQSNYGQQINTFPLTSSYNVQPLGVAQSDQTVIIPKTINTPVRGYGYTMQQALFDEKPQPVLQLTQADIHCQGQRPESVIPLEGGRRFVVCLDESKGVEQQCPKGLFFHTESRRCERRLGALENPCASQPCLNNGQCLVTDASSFQCKCAAGFDGINCELDARICQTQQPCGQAPGSRCQSFRAGAALQYICIHENELAFGLNAQQIQSSPCRGTDGALPLGISDKGFVMCDGERMFIESCPGGTIWDDLNKACVWPDMQGFISTSKTIEEQYKQHTHRLPAMIVPPTIIPQQTFVAPIQAPQLDVVRTVSSFGQNQIQRPSFDFNVLPSKLVSHTSAHIQRPSLDFQRSSFEIQRPSFDTKVFPTETSSFGNQKTQEIFQKSQETLQRPQEIFQRPQETFQRPQETFLRPQETFQRPQETFQRPQETFLRPQETFQRPQETFLRPQETFQQSQETFQQPQHIFQQPMQKQQDFRSVQQTSSY